VLSSELPLPGHSSSATHGFPQFLQVDTVSIAVTTVSPIEFAVAILILAVAWMVLRHGTKIRKLLLKLFGVFTLSLETSDDDQKDDSEKRPEPPD